MTIQAHTAIIKSGGSHHSCVCASHHFPEPNTPAFPLPSPHGQHSAREREGAGGAYNNRTVRQNKHDHEKCVGADAKRPAKQARRPSTASWERTEAAERGKAGMRIVRKRKGVCMITTWSRRGTTRMDASTTRRKEEVARDWTHRRGHARPLRRKGRFSGSPP